METPNGPQILLAQAIELPDFSGLPLFAQGVLYTVAAIAIGLSIIIPRIGFMFGKKAEATKPEPTIAAVIVDPTALNNHAAQIKELAGEVSELRTELRIVREVGLKIRRANS